MNRIARAVLFDLDGTLVDSAPDLGAAANAMREHAGLPALPLTSYRPVASRGSRALLKVALPHLDEATRETWIDPFLDAYARDIAVHSRLFDGVAAVLEAIERDGAAWGVVTNKPERLARALMDALKLSARCAVLIGGDTLPQRKPDPQPLWFACDMLGVAATNSLYVGDDERDVQAARAAGMRCIAAAWGYRDGEAAIERWGADCVLAQPRDLLQDGVLRAHV